MSVFPEPQGTFLLPFSEAEMVDIRRYCGYPAYAAGGYTMEEDYGMLETRLLSMTDNERGVIRTAYLPNLYTLEAAVVGAGANLDTDQAAVWKHNKNEVSDRASLLILWGQRLCSFIGVRPGRGIGSGGRVVRT